MHPQPRRVENGAKKQMLQHEALTSSDSIFDLVSIWKTEHHDDEVKHMHSMEFNTGILL
jgi:hypothetical protein